MKKLDMLSTDYTSVVGELGVWKDSAFFHTEGIQDVINELKQKILAQKRSI